MSKKSKKARDTQAQGKQTKKEKKIDVMPELEQKLKDLEDKYLRLYAEFDNFRKRTEQEKDEFAKYSAGSVVNELLPIIDSFERAQASFEAHNTNAEDLKKGVALIHKQFEDCFEKLGVKKIEAKGKRFDPHFHEAVMQQESDQEPETIIEEMQPGFMIYDKVLRHSMVIVSKGK